MTASAIPGSFTQLPGWRESFAATLDRLRTIRADSLADDATFTLVGEPVRAFTLGDWMQLHQAGNPYVCGTNPLGQHAAQVIGLLHRRMRYSTTRWGRLRRCLLTQRLMRAVGYNEAALVQAVEDYVEDAFIDMPGRINASAGTARFNPTQVERKELQISLCAEIMTAFPAFTRAALCDMPLAQFWQWLHAARAKADPEYRNDQLTDEVNRQFCGQLNRLRKAQHQAPAA